MMACGPITPSHLHPHPPCSLLRTPMRLVPGRQAPPTPICTEKRNDGVLSPRIKIWSRVERRARTGEICVICYIYVEGKGGRARGKPGPGQGWGPRGASHPPLPLCPPRFRCPHPHDLSAQVHPGARVGPCLCPAPRPGPCTFPGLGSWCKGASPVTFPQGPDTLLRPLHLSQTLGQGFGGPGWGPPPAPGGRGPAQLPSDLVPAPSGWRACVRASGFTLQI